MIKVNFLTNNGRSTGYASEDATIREVLEENNINYAVGVTQLDGISLKPGDMDKRFEEFGIGETCYLSVVVKADNAVKVTVVGEAAVITSDLKLEDIKTAKKYRPEALKLYKDKEQVYQIGVTSRSSGSINNVGAEFSETTDKEGHATITLSTDREGDAAEEVMDKIGLPLLMVSRIEEAFAEHMTAIKADQDKIKALIDVQ